MRNPAEEGMLAAREENRQREQKIRNTAATTDMRRARKAGVLAITDTKRGVVEVSYEVGYKLYAISEFQGGKIIAKGRAGEILPVLAALYTVDGLQ